MNRNTKVTRRPKRRRNSRLIIAIICGTLLVAGIVFSILYFKPFGNKTDDSQKEEKSNSTSSSGNSVESSNSNKKEEENQREPEKNNLKYDESSLGDTKELKGIINFAGISNEKLLINTTIYQEFGSDGTCEVSLTGPTGRKITGKVATEAGPSATFCSYDTPANGIESGKWQVTVVVKHNNYSGTMTTEVEI